jgi:hypothetical protein
VFVYVPNGTGPNLFSVGTREKQTYVRHHVPTGPKSDDHPIPSCTYYAVGAGPAGTVDDVRRLL